MGNSKQHSRSLLKLLISLSIITFALLLSPSRSSASERVNELIQDGLTQGQAAAQNLREELKKINNYFLIGEDLKIDTPVNGNLIVIADSVEFTGDVEGGMFIIAGDVSVTGKISRSLWIFSREADVDGEISGNARIFTSSLDIKGNVSGNLFAICADAIFDGAVTGRALILGRGIGVDSEDMSGKFYIMLKRPGSED